MHVPVQNHQSCNPPPVVQSHQTDDGSRSRVPFTFTDADYIKTYIILPLYHM